MTDNTQANWNIIKIVYGYGDLYVEVVDKENNFIPLNSIIW